MKCTGCTPQLIMVVVMVYLTYSERLHFILLDDMCVILIGR